MEQRNALGETRAPQAASGDAGTPAAEPDVRPLHLLIALVVLLGLVGLVLWVVPQTIGAGVVNITVR